MSQQGFIEELKWRGMLHDSTPGIEEHLTKGMRTGYIGFDPTAPSLTIGNYVQVMILDLFQKAGHQPIILMGGATGRIGDPSGKDSERELKPYDELDRNLQHQEGQFRRLLNFDEGKNKALLLNNYDFYKAMPVLEFLRDVGKHMTINYMLAKDSVQNRLETGMSYTEFSYQVLQAYDYLCLFRDFGCTVQMGGSDQWGNITSGTEFIRKNTTEGKAYAVTTPLLTKTDGSKFGKSESGNIWLDPAMTSPYQFYQFWINADDRDVPKFLKFFSLKSHDEILHLESQMEGAPRDVKKSLAEEITSRVHSHEDYVNAAQVSEILFNPKAGAEELHAMSATALGMIASEIPSFKIGKSVIANGTDILELMAGHTTICTSKGEARRAVQSNAVSINKVKVTGIDASVTSEHLLHGTYMLLENGKKNKFILEVTQA
jgi:tyrosyl-tRNA synthetase